MIKAVLEERGLWVILKLLAPTQPITFGHRFRQVPIDTSVLSSGFFMFQGCTLQASMRSPNMETFKQQKVEDFYDIGEELGR